MVTFSLHRCFWGVCLTLRGGGVIFILLPACPLHLWKFRKFAKFRQMFFHFLQIPAIPTKFRENFDEKHDIWTDFMQNLQNLEKSSNFAEFCKNPKEFEFEAVQRIVNLVELEKRWKMSIWLQNLASIQPRTSPPKFWPACLPPPPLPVKAPTSM